MDCPEDGVWVVSVTQNHVCLHAFAAPKQTSGFPPTSVIQGAYLQDRIWPKAERQLLKI